MASRTAETRKLHHSQKIYIRKAVEKWRTMKKELNIKSDVEFADTLLAK